MGGKGGGGEGPSTQQALDFMATDPGQQGYYKPQYEATKKNYKDEADWYAHYGGAAPEGTPTSGAGANQFNKDLFTRYYGAAPATPAPAPAPAAAPAPEPAAAAAPTPATPAPTTPAPTGDPLGAGGGIGQPGSTGNQLGGAILNPPKYWVGGIDSYNKSPRGGGALRTTQT